MRHTHSRVGWEVVCASHTQQGGVGGSVCVTHTVGWGGR